MPVAGLYFLQRDFCCWLSLSSSAIPRTDSIVRECGRAPGFVDRASFRFAPKHNRFAEDGWLYAGTRCGVGVSLQGQQLVKDSSQRCSPESDSESWRPVASVIVR